MTEQMTEIKIPVTISPMYSLIGMAQIENRCCPGRPVLITANQARDLSGRQYTNYSCQCSCGMWCTTGERTASAALQEWERMTERAKKEARCC